MRLQEALQLYKIPYMIETETTAPGFTSYKLKPTAAAATLQKIKTRLDDIIIATGQRLELIQDQSGLYIREKTAATVYNYFDYNGYIDYNNPDIPFIVGFNQSGIVLDSMDAARHILIAGTTGSGKSVFLHNLITTFCCNPNCYLYLVDCKQVEFSIYENNALIASDVFGERSAATFTASLVDVMEKRYKEMKAAGVNDFSDFQKIDPTQKRHILVIDELSDLLSDRHAEKIIVPRLLRLAQKGRAAGVHVILATQRPDSTVINGTLKGNMPTRIAFRTISNIDSRIILDQSGAERLAGNGDGLYLRNGAFNLERVQSPYISIEDIKRRT